MNENNSLLRDIGRSFIVSSFIPAALFVALATLLFRDFIPHFLRNQIFPNDQLFAGQWALMLIVVFWLGYALYSSWNFTVKIFEGYYIAPGIAQYFSDRLFWEKEKKTARIKEFKRLQSMPNFPSNDADKKKQFEALEDYQLIEWQFPKERNDFLPTRLGNILRASENYAWDRYRMEGTTLYSRLVYSFPSSFTGMLEEQNNKFIFLLNSALLCILIWMISWTVVLIRLPCHILHPNIMSRYLTLYAGFACTTNNQPINFFQAGFSNYSETKYFFIGIAFLAIGYFLYRTSVIAASVYTRIIRTGFDLYRFDLLKSLRMELPKDLYDEQTLWRSISQLLIADEELGRINLPYKHEKEAPADEESSTTIDRIINLKFKPLSLTMQTNKHQKMISSEPEE